MVKNGQSNNPAPPVSLQGEGRDNFTFTKGHGVQQQSAEEGIRNHEGGYKRV